MMANGSWRADHLRSNGFRQFYRDWRPRDVSSLPVLALHGSLTQSGMWTVIAETMARTRSTQEAALMVLREQALKGNTRALDRLLELALRFNNDEGELAQQLPGADQAILAAYVAQFAAVAMTSATGGLADDPVSKPGAGSVPKARK
jgi:hypothetical protein